MKSSGAEIRERLSASTYLQRLFNQFSELDLPDVGEAMDRLQQILLDTQQVPAELLADAEALRRFLLERKANFVICWAVADLSEAASTEQLGSLQTQFAEWSVELALRAAWQLPEHRKLFSDIAESTQALPGLFVLGLGKLGGGDLNFSSDIDLVAFFDRDTFPINPMQGPADVAARLLRWVTRFLEYDRGEGFLWRVDWRLRPESSATQLAMSADAALDYYYFRSLPWHRLAMMKARPIAGDMQLGRDFLQDMERFIWRQNLDFRALDELAELKEKIDLEHPALKRQRAQEKGVSHQAEGYNLKLGTGGIREIEFFANALQLIWGGKRPTLRVTHTTTALSRLVEEDLLEADLAAEMSQAYWWLRRHENRLQMLDNRQTHSLPRDSSTRDRYCRLTDIADWQGFSETLYQRRSVVHRHFLGLFQADSKTSESTEELIQWPDLSEVSQDVVDMWEQGFRGYGVSASQRSGLDQLYRKLSKAILASGREPEESIQRIHAYFQRLPPGGQYFRLLQNSPGLVDGLIMPLLYSPPMRTLLEQTPHIIDSLLESGRDSQDMDVFVFHSPDYETRLERMRRLVNEQLYQYYLDFLNDRLQANELQAQLTNLAEYALGMASRVVSEQLKVDQAPVCIIGLGKLGMGLLAPLSDLDILYVCNSGTTLEQANRFVHRLQTALSASMKEGVVYEMDTRLRPSGRSGPPTVTLDSFSQYQLERAKTGDANSSRYVAATAIPTAAHAGCQADVGPPARPAHCRLCGPGHINQVAQGWPDGDGVPGELCDHSVGAAACQSSRSDLPRPGGCPQ